MDLRRLLPVLALFAAFAAPAQAQEPNPTTCEGYPEQRVFLESQSWWDDGELLSDGDTEHVHTGVCVPLYQTVDGTVRFDIVTKLHNLPGWQQVTNRIQDASDTLESQSTRPTNCETNDCTLLTRIDVNLGARATGMHELRFHSEARPSATTAEANLATNGWQVCVRSCSPDITQATNVPEGRGWYQTSERSVKGYINGRYDSPNLPHPAPAGEKVSGRWCPPLRVLQGAGSEPVERSRVVIDPDFHAGDAGQSLVNTIGEFAGSPCIDTTKLRDGVHKLSLIAYSSSVFSGQLWGVLVVPFTVDNLSSPSPLAVAGNSEVKLDWDDSDEAALAGYNVYRSSTPGGPYSKVNGSLLTSSSYTDATASNGTTYHYVVRAVDSGGRESPNSKEVSAKPYASPYRDAVTATPGLVSYWRLGEGSGTRAVDQQLRNHGAFQGGVTLGEAGALTGDPDTAARFDGADDVVQAPHTGSLDPDSVTVEVWARSDGAVWNQHGWLASKRDKFILHPLANTRTVSWYVQQDNGGWERVDFTPSDIAGWHHYAGTYDATSGELALYVDGAKVASRTLAPGKLRSSTAPLRIGADSGGLSSRYGKGWIDEPALYGTALSGSAIGDHYRARAAP